nr:hypothetical protein [Nocardia panacis]
MDAVDVVVGAEDWGGGDEASVVAAGDVLLGGWGAAAEVGEGVGEVDSFVAFESADAGPIAGVAVFGDDRDGLVEGCEGFDQVPGHRGASSVRVGSPTGAG